MVSKMPPETWGRPGEDRGTTFSGFCAFWTNGMSNIAKTKHLKYLKCITCPKSWYIPKSGQTCNQRQHAVKLATVRPLGIKICNDSFRRREPRPIRENEQLSNSVRLGCCGQVGAPKHGTFPNTNLAAGENAIKGSLGT